jgi:hypothetical protein
MKRDIVLLAALAVCGVNPAVRGELIVGNLTPSPLGSFSVNSLFLVAQRVDFDGSFTAHTLTSAVLSLATNTSPEGSDPTIPANLELFSDNGGTSPGSLVAKLGSASVLNNQPPANYTFMPASAPILSPSTSYWLVFGLSPGLNDTILWEVLTNATLDPGSLAGASIPGGTIVESIDGGAHWVEAIGGHFRFQFALNGNPVAAPVPEPSTLALAGSAGLLVAGYGWNRRRRRDVVPM